jgi:hypothetical protein
MSGNATYQELVKRNQDKRCPAIRWAGFVRAPERPMGARRYRYVIFLRHILSTLSTPSVLAVSWHAIQFP